MDDFQHSKHLNEDFKQEIYKKITQMYREIEKLQVLNERKVNIELFNERLELKADK